MGQVGIALDLALTELGDDVAGAESRSLGAAAALKKLETENKN